jgi:hypothetical protein
MYNIIKNDCIKGGRAEFDTPIIDGGVILGCSKSVSDAKYFIEQCISQNNYEARGYDNQSQYFWARKDGVLSKFYVE